MVPTDIIPDKPATTGWNIKGGILGGAEEKRAASPEQRTPSKRMKEQPLRVVYQNINGLKSAKPELHSFLVENDIDIMFVSEVQKQDGDLFSTFNIPD